MPKPTSKTKTFYFPEEGNPQGHPVTVRFRMTNDEAIAFDYIIAARMKSGYCRSALGIDDWPALKRLAAEESMKESDYLRRALVALAQGHVAPSKAAEGPGPFTFSADLIGVPSQQDIATATEVLRRYLPSPCRILDPFADVGYIALAATTEGHDVYCCEDDPTASAVLRFQLDVASLRESVRMALARELSTAKTRLIGRLDKAEVPGYLVDQYHGTFPPLKNLGLRRADFVDAAARCRTIIPAMPSPYSHGLTAAALKAVNRVSEGGGLEASSESPLVYFANIWKQELAALITFCRNAPSIRTFPRFVSVPATDLDSMISLGLDAVVTRAPSFVKRRSEVAHCFLQIPSTRREDYTTRDIQQFTRKRFDDKILAVRSDSHDTLAMLHAIKGLSDSLQKLDAAKEHRTMLLLANFFLRVGRVFRGVRAQTKSDTKIVVLLRQMPLQDIPFEQLMINSANASGFKRSDDSVAGRVLVLERTRLPKVAPVGHPLEYS